MRLLRGTGVHAESEFAYASAHQLLRPLLPLIDSLPAPQAHAVNVALGMASGGPPDRFLVALGFLSLLSEAGRDQPLLCLLDDVQWCDSASTDALVFAVRRLSADPVAFLFSVRDEPGVAQFELAGVPEVDIAGLSEEAGVDLLSEVTGASVPIQVGAMLVRYTRGNPLALLELARALNRDQLDGSEPLPDPLPVGDRVEVAFLDRARRLSSEAQHLLLLAAAEESGELDVIVAAFGELGVAEKAMAEAERSGLLAVSQGSLQFSHPLVRSAIYRDAKPPARRAAHHALAERLGERGHLDRRAWHHAAAATGLDEDLSGELERLALRAAQRSGYGAASTGYERAADLSPNASDRTRRLVAAADSAWMAGQANRARNLVQRAEETTDDPVLQACLLHLRGRAASRNGELDEAYRILIDGADMVRDLAPPQALEMLADAVEAAMYAGDGVRAGAGGAASSDDRPRHRSPTALLVRLACSRQHRHPRTGLERRLGADVVVAR